MEERTELFSHTHYVANLMDPSWECSDCAILISLGFYYQGFRSGLISLVQALVLLGKRNHLAAGLILWGYRPQSQ